MVEPEYLLNARIMPQINTQPNIDSAYSNASVFSSILIASGIVFIVISLAISTTLSPLLGLVNYLQLLVHVFLI